MSSKTRERAKARSAGSGDFEEERNGISPFASIGVGVVVVTALVATGHAILSGGHGHAPSSAPVTVTHATAAGSSSVCGLPDGGSTLPSSGPKVTWRLDESSRQMVPSSSTAGPGRPRNDRAGTCYSHSAEGAVLAAANMFLAFQDPALSDDALGAMVVKDGNEHWVLDQLADRATAPVAGLLAGYRLDDYTPARATVDLVMQVTSGPSKGVYADAPWVLVWEPSSPGSRLGDWRIQGSPVEDQEPVVTTTLAGYTPWSGA